MESKTKTLEEIIFGASISSNKNTKISKTVFLGNSSFRGVSGLQPTPYLHDYIKLSN